MDFRELTLQRLKHFVSQNFFSVFDYLQGKSFDFTLCWLTSSLSYKSSCTAQLYQLRRCIALQIRCVSWLAWRP